MEKLLAHYRWYTNNPEATEEMMRADMRIEAGNALSRWFTDIGDMYQISKGRSPMYEMRLSKEDFDYIKEIFK